jgi:hypothetical protein
MAARPTIAKARKTTNFIESYSGCYGIDGMAPTDDRLEAKLESLWRFPGDG